MDHTRKLNADVLLHIFECVPANQRINCKNVCVRWKGLIEAQDGQYRNTINTQHGEDSFEIIQDLVQGQWVDGNRSLYDIHHDLNCKKTQTWERFRSLQFPLTRLCCVGRGDVVTLWKDVDDQFCKGDQAFVEQVKGDNLTVRHVRSNITKNIVKGDCVHGFPVKAMEFDKTCFPVLNNRQIFYYPEPGAIIGLQQGLDIVDVEYLDRKGWNGVYRESGNLIVADPSLISEQDRKYMKRAKRVCNNRPCPHSPEGQQRGYTNGSIPIYRPKRPR